MSDPLHGTKTGRFDMRRPAPNQEVPAEPAEPCDLDGFDAEVEDMLDAGGTVCSQCRSYGASVHSAPRPTTKKEA